MNKKLLSLPVAAIMSISLAGCGINDNETAVQDRNNNNVQPIGYYSSDNQRNGGGNARILDEVDNDGPVTEMMDQTFNNRDRNYQRLQNNGFSRNDANYHGHLGNNERKPRSSYYEGYDGKFINQINQAAHVNNVRDVESLVRGNDVLIAVNLADNDRKQETIAKIRQAVSPYLNGKTAYIATDPSTFNHIKVIDNDLRQGGPRDQINLDTQNIFNALKKR
ncbi:YhcN/YlaJ family sporulation lipoprotein [Bacillus sp. DTU_2020_1000418_1_SI_GHA_SEK_038]|uniref:YhcN/YlaJ family sporulation lipoprotein n=1 Tax=Bacillus sp. DTU_2020_1000418_1_SI_GHA_SEK_038 TaxID=3077585 RepID=UPI0028E43135|nr:YhcN/YlaJ family sporulation lipoprotein [Bacillus sp. DTU_2020_1000418_1_SI_GHA_SEK_038]WNS74435.1 YhcN/YlaJ family sporulation lipoprotein [Bacillus sp. DTU_2020_1000418_1_SI_GHA_SEK_038]